MRVDIGTSDNRARKSWLSLLFPSVARLEETVLGLQETVRRLEDENEKIGKERDILFDRAMRLTTGYGINEQMPNIVETTRAIAEQQNKVSNFRLADELERESLQRRINGDREASKSQPEEPVKSNGDGS